MNHKQAEKSGIVNALTNTKKQWSHCDIFRSQRILYNAANGNQLFPTTGILLLFDAD